MNMEHVGTVGIGMETKVLERNPGQYKSVQHKQEPAVCLEDVQLNGLTPDRTKPQMSLDTFIIKQRISWQDVKLTTFQGILCSDNRCSHS
jgi:hypothetical protein